MIKDFEYLAPTSVDEALSLFSQYKEEAKLIAGGQSLLVVMKQGLLAPEYMIDIKGLSALDYVEYDKDTGLRIGALTVHRAIEKSPVIKQHFPVLCEMERNLATIQTRNWGTIGGNICHADPAGDPATVFIALNARLKLTKLGGERTINAEDFFKGYLEVDLEHGEMLTEIQVPPLPEHTGCAHDKLMVMQGDMGVVGAAAAITLDGNGTCREARIVISNAAPLPLRPKQAESTLQGKVLDEALLAQAGDVAATETDPPSDVHGSPEYRREMVKVFVRRVAAKALEKAKAA